MPETATPFWLDRQDLQQLIEALQAAGHRVIGPQVRDAAVVYDDLPAAAALPHGLIDEQDGGWYRLIEQALAGPFDHVAGPHSLKNFLFPPRETIQQWRREEGSWRQVNEQAIPVPLAVIGPRACDLRALAIQDQVFLEGEYVDPFYRARRERLFIVAVNCRRAAATCFCHSMGCGPEVTIGHDLLLTPVCERFVVEIGSAAGATVAAELAAGRLPCTTADLAAAREVSRELAAAMASRPMTPVRPHAQVAPTALPIAGPQPRPVPAHRSLDTENIRDLLFDNLEHDRWAEVAERCLACGNCTMVCPTCFCSSVTEVAELSGDNVSRERHWASCFTAEHGQMHGANARPTTAARYRQWLTHKLAGWIDQFGSSGCTGCGRCITWCPVGIDLTEEVAAIRETSS
jgi:sulfhydrogenase subunit beta (sulfur reductase)